MKKLVLLLPVLLAFLIFTLVLTSCQPPAAAKDSSGQKVEAVAAVAYAGGVSALVLLDKLQADQIAALTSASDATLAKLQARVDRLRRARAGLALVKDWLEGKTGDKAAAFADAFEALKLVLAELRADGVQVPSDVDAGLAAAAAYLEVNPG